MKIITKHSIDLRTTCSNQMPNFAMQNIEMLLPGGCTSSIGSSSCSCGVAVIKQ